MRRRLSLTAALVLLLSLLCACAAQHAQEMDENGYELYFLSDPNSAGGGDAIRTQEKRLTLDGAMETEDCVRALMEALLAGPDEPSLSSPIPEGTALKSLKVSGRRAQIDLSAQYARLTGIDLSLADYCITLTLTQLPNVNAVSITADGRELPYRETQVLLSADTLLSSRESGLRPITVSLYFLDSKTGELRAEQQTLALYEGQTRVNALLEALAQGPEDDSLVSLLPEDFAATFSQPLFRGFSCCHCLHDLLEQFGVRLCLFPCLLCGFLADFLRVCSPELCETSLLSAWLLLGRGGYGGIPLIFWSTLVYSGLVYSTCGLFLVALACVRRLSGGRPPVV